MEKTIHSVRNQALTRWLREQREKNGLTMRQAAVRLNVPHTWIGKVEQGERRIDVLEFLALCEAIGANPVDGLRAVGHQINAANSRSRSR